MRTVLKEKFIILNTHIKKQTPHRNLKQLNDIP